MGQTTNPVLRYPDIDDPVAVHTDMLKLATDVESAFQADRKTLNEIGTRNTYTPVWDGGAPLDIADGSIRGDYVIVGKLMVVAIMIVRGTKTNVGGAAYTFSLPQPARQYQTISGTGIVGQGAGIPCTVIGVASGAVGLLYNSVPVRVSNQTPPNGMAWGPNQWMHLSITALLA